MGIITSFIKFIVTKSNYSKMFDSVFQEQLPNNQIVKDQEELESLWINAYTTFHLEALRHSFTAKQGFDSKKFSSYMVPRVQGTLRTLWDTALLKGINSAGTSKISLSSSVSGNLLEFSLKDEIDIRGLTQAQLEAGGFYSGIQAGKSEEELMAIVRKLGVSKAPLLNRRAEDRSPKEKIAASRKLSTLQKANPLEKKVGEYETRERVRTLQAGFPALRKGSIFSDYLDKRTNIASINIDQGNQERVKKLTKQYLDSRDPVKVEQKIIQALSVTKGLDKKQRLALRKYVSSQIGAKNAQLDLPPGLANEAVAKGIYKNFKIASNPDTFLKSLTTVRNSSKDLVLSELSEAQKGAKRDLSESAKQKIESQLNSFREGGSIRELRQNKLDVAAGKDDPIDGPNKLTKARFELADLMKQRTQVLTGIKNGTRSREELSALDSKIEAKTNSVNKIKVKVKELEGRLSGTPDNTKLLTLDKSLRRKIAAITYRNPNRWEDVPAKASYQQLQNIKEEIKSTKLNEITNINDSTRLGVTEISSAYNIGRMQSFIDSGVDYVQFRSVSDSKRSVFCGSLEGKIYKVTEFAAVMAGQKWPLTREPETSPNNIKMVPRSVVSGAGLWHPPCHSYCRAYFVPLPSAATQSMLGLTDNKLNKSLAKQRTAGATPSSIENLIAQQKGLSIKQDKNRLFSLRRRNVGSTPTATRTRLIELLTSPAIETARRVSTYGRIFNTGHQILKQLNRRGYSIGVANKEDSDSIAKALLVGGSILSSAALFYFFSKSNLATSLKEYFTNLGVDASSEKVTQIVVDLMKTPEAKADEFLMNLQKQEPKNIPEFELIENQRRSEALKALLVNPDNIEKQSVQQIIKALSSPTVSERDLYVSLMGSLKDRLDLTKEIANRTFATAIGNTSKISKDLKDIQKIQEYYNRLQVYFTNDKGKTIVRYASKKAFDSPEYKKIVSEIQSDIRNMEDTISQLEDISLQEKSPLESALLKKEIQALRQQVLSLRQYGNTLTTKPTVVKEAVSTPEVRIRKINELLERKVGEIDTLRGNYLDAESKIDAITEAAGISEGKTREILLSSNKALKQQYEERIATAIGEIESQFIDDNLEYIDPLKKMGKRTSLGNTLEELNSLGINDESYVEVLSNLKSDYFSTIEEKLSTLNQMLRRLAKIN
jgi:hypothetical protein